MCRSRIAQTIVHSPCRQRFPGSSPGRAAFFSRPATDIIIIIMSENSHLHQCIPSRTSSGATSQLDAFRISLVGVSNVHFSGRPDVSYYLATLLDRMGVYQNAAASTSRYFI